MRVAALIPAYNEGERVGATVKAVHDSGIASRILVVDDGSDDGTGFVARTAGAEVLELEQNLGKGTALDAGLAVLGTEWDILLMLDADLGESASEATLLVEPIAGRTADMTIAGFPPPEGKAGFGIVKEAARRGIHEMGDASFPATAPLSGQRAMTRECAQIVTPFAFGYGVEVALTIRALRAGLRVVEVPTTMSHAATGRDLSGFLHRGRQYLHVRRALSRLRREASA